MADDYDEDPISQLVAAGILLAVGYGLFTVVRSILGFDAGQTVRADEITEASARADAPAVEKVGFMSYGRDLFDAHGVKQGYITYSEELYDASGNKLGYVTYSNDIYDADGEKIGYTNYSNELYDTSGAKIAFATYSNEIFSAADLDLDDHEGLTLALGLGAVISRDND